MRAILLGLLTVFVFMPAGHSQSCWLVNAKGDSLAGIRDHRLYMMHSPKAGFCIRGNMIFKGPNDDHDSLLYLLKALDIFSGRGGDLLSANEQEQFLHFSKGKVILNLNETGLSYARIEANDSGYRITSPDKGELLGRIYGTGSDAEVVALFSILDLRSGLRDSVYARALRSRPESSSFARLIPDNSDGILGAWEWDGQFLYPVNSSNLMLRWSFDGETLKPYFMNNLMEEFSWDGKILKPVYRNNIELEWTLEGNRIAKSWPHIDSPEYNITEGKVESTDSWKYPNWKIEGDFPPALIVFILSGMARR